MPQGLVCHKTVVHNALYVTIPIYHSRELFMHGVLCVTVTFALCSMPVVFQGLICHKVQYDIWLGLGLGFYWKHIGSFAYRACGTTDRVTQWDPLWVLRHIERGAYRHCDITGMLHIGLYPLEHADRLCGSCFLELLKENIILKKKGGGRGHRHIISGR